MIRVAVISSGEERFLKLPKSASISTDSMNPALDLDTAIPGIFSMNLKIPVEGNASVLNFAQFTHVQNKYRSYPIRVYDDTQPQFTGLLLISSSELGARQDVFDCDVVADGIGPKLQGVTIRHVLDQEVVLGQTTAEIVAAAKAKNSEPAESGVYCFPQYQNKSHFGGKNEGDEGVVFVNWWDQITQSFESNRENPAYDGIVDEPKWLNQFALAPSVYTHSIARAIFEWCGFTVSGEYFDHPDLQKEVCLGQYSLDKYSERYAATLRASDSITFSGTYGAGSPYFGTSIPLPLNTADKDTTDSGVDTSGDGTSPGGHQFPLDIEGDYVLRMVLFITSSSPIEVKFVKMGSGGANYTVVHSETLPSGTNEQHVITASTNTLSTAVGGHIAVVFTNSFGTSWTMGANSQFDVFRRDEATRNVFRGQFNLGNCLPDIGAGQFLKNLKVRWGLQFHVDNLAKNVKVNFARSMFDSPPLDVNGLLASKDFKKKPQDHRTLNFGFSSGGDQIDSSRFQGAVLTFDDLPLAPIISEKWIYWVASRNGFFEFILNDDETAFIWSRMKESYWHQSLGEGEARNISIVNALVAMVDDGKALIPELDDSGNSDLYGLGIDGFDERYLFFYGMQPGEDGNYPFATQGCFSREEVQLGSHQQVLSDTAQGITSPFENWRQVLSAINGAPRFTRRLLIDTRATHLPFDRLLLLDQSVFILESLSETISESGRSVSGVFIKINR